MDGLVLFFFAGVNALFWICLVLVVFFWIVLKLSK